MAKVMIVDDASFMREVLKHILREHGHEIVAEASSGEEAIRLYKQHRPDLTTMDITMPEMSGIQALKKILSIDERAKVIMCSARSQKNIVIEAVQAGAQDYIVKPFQQDRLLEMIGKLVCGASS
jgi:two-component system chemotaxis response regulator CheY